MKLYLDCIPCFQKQALFVTKDLDEKLRSKILRKVIHYLYNIEWETSPDELSQHIYELIKKETGIDDPYLEIKKQSTQEAKKFYPRLKEKLQGINDDEERFYTAVLIAIAGNIIDFGPQIKIDLQKTLSEVLEKDPGINDIGLLYKKIHTSETLLYFADNAGEIVFDKIFIEEMIAIRKRPFKKISFVIKGIPIINDAMIVDADESEIDKLPNIVYLKLGNGDSQTGYKRKDKIVEQWIDQHDLVISKGQGNFEGLNNYKGIFFLLMAKCSIIANELGVKEMDTVVKLNN